MSTRQDTQISTENGLSLRRKRGQRLKKAARSRLKTRGLALAGSHHVTDICQMLGIHRRTWYAWLHSDATFRTAHSDKLDTFRLSSYDELSYEHLQSRVSTMTDRQLIATVGRLSRRSWSL